MFSRHIFTQLEVLKGLLPGWPACLKLYENAWPCKIQRQFHVYSDNQRRRARLTRLH
jgi:hypothetical protein